MGEGGIHETDPRPDCDQNSSPNWKNCTAPPARCGSGLAPEMVLLAAERGLTAREISEIVRASEETVRRWLKRYLAEGVEGLRDEPQPGAPRRVTQEYREGLIHAVRRRPRSLGLAFSVWTLQRLADYVAEKHGHPGELRDGAGTPEERRDSTQPPPAHHHESRSRVRPQKKAIEQTRDGLDPADHFYYADEFNLSWMPTLKAIWGPKGSRVDPHARPTQKALRHRSC